MATVSSRFRLVPGLCLAVMLALVSQRAHAQANLITNGSFESGNWDGSTSFVDPNNATALLFWNNQVASWTPNSGSDWIQDPTRASNLNRFVWLGPPGSSTPTFISQTVYVNGNGNPAAALVTGATYHIGLDIDFFNQSDPNNTMGMMSTVQVYFELGNAMVMGDPNSPMLSENPSTLTNLITASGTTDGWATIHWTSTGADFVMPDTTGYDYLRIFIAAPQDSGNSPSVGVLVDNVSLVAVPEPGSLMLGCAAVAIFGWRRRRA